MNPRGDDRKDALTLTPASLGRVTGGQTESEARIVKLRVYADDDYRSTVLHWQSKVRTQVERVNHVVAPLFHCRFEIEELRPWSRSHVGVGFEPLLTELQALDPARDVDWVLGLATAFQGVATSVHQVGGARYLSRHFIMRAMDDAEESRALDRRLNSLPVGEREALYQQRKAHKELIVFLHEWAHSMGALHVDSDRQVMNPSYDLKQTSFTDFQRRLIALVVDSRLSDRTKPYPESAALPALLAEMPANEGMTRDRTALTEIVQARAQPQASAFSAAMDGSVMAPDELRSALDAAIRLVVADDLAGATPLVLEAARLFGERPPSDPRQALQLAQVASHVGALTIAGAALARADSKTELARQVAAAVEAIRRLAGLPRDGQSFGVAATDEPAYIAAFRRLSLLAVQSDRKADYQRSLKDFAQRYPAVPGAKLVLCENDLRAGRVAAAERNCQGAATAFPELVRGHYLLGLLAERSGRIADAEKALRRAVRLEPEDPVWWRELSRFYERTRNTVKLRQLDAERSAIATIQQRR